MTLLEAFSPAYQPTAFDGHVPLGIQARMIADSISPLGVRVCTIEATLHRFVLAEMNTHRVFSRNSASSRAIPVTRQLRRIKTLPAFPAAWPCEKKGMAGGIPLEGIDLEDVEDLFSRIADFTVTQIEEYLERVTARYIEADSEELKLHILHKSALNRLLEPFMWHTVVLTATEWQGFFDQRVHAAAQTEIRLAAESVLCAMEASTPSLLEYGQWHVPYIRDEDWVWALGEYGEAGAVRPIKEMSAARCARTSFLGHDGVRAPQEDLRLLNELVGNEPLHASPLEHVCTPALPGETPLGNLREFRQFRHEIEGLSVSLKSSDNL